MFDFTSYFAIIYRERLFGASKGAIKHFHKQTDYATVAIKMKVTINLTRSFACKVFAY